MSSGGPRRRGGAVAVALVLGVVLAGSRAMQAWTSLQHEQARPAWSAAGTQVSVLLTNATASSPNRARATCA